MAIAVSFLPTIFGSSLTPPATTGASGPRLKNWKDITSAPRSKRYEISTKNTARLTLREMNRASEIRIDGQTLRVKGAPEIALEKSASGWKPASGKRTGL